VVCRATLFNEEARFSVNIDFQYPMKQACLREIDRYCKDVPHGQARVIRCLQVGTAPYKTSGCDV
jgi:Golgi apparatus protein 1